MSTDGELYYAIQSDSGEDGTTSYAVDAPTGGQAADPSTIQQGQTTGQAIVAQGVGHRQQPAVRHQRPGRHQQRLGRQPLRHTDVL